MSESSAWDGGLDRHKVQPAWVALNLQVERDKLPAPVKPHGIGIECPAAMWTVDGEGQAGLTLGAMRFKVAEDQGTAPERQSQIADHSWTDLGLGEGKVRNVTRGGSDKGQNDSTKACDEQKSQNKLAIATKQAKLDAVELQNVWKQRHPLASPAHIAPFGSSHSNR